MACRCARRAAVFTLSLLVLLAACGVDESGLDDLTRRDDLLRGVVASPSPTATPTPPSELPGEWHEDVNNNRIPDFIEVAQGWDLDENRCVASLDCGGVDDEVVLQEFATLLMLDASGSMADEVADGQKMGLAKEALTFYATGIPETTDLGFLVYGHKGSMDPAERAASCEGAEVLAPLGEVDYESLPGLLEEFSPTGFTPLGVALEKAAGAFEGREGSANRVVVVSDGQETCGGDPVAAAGALADAGIAVVDVVAFDVPDEQLADLEAIAQAGGGELVIADDGAELREALLADLSAFYETAAAQACVVTQSVAAKGCLAAEQTRVTLAFDEHKRTGPAEEESWDEEQLEQIQTIEREAELWNVEQQQLVEGAGLPRIEQLRRALTDAEARMKDVYGDELDLSALDVWTCPSRWLARRLVGFPF